MEFTDEEKLWLLSISAEVPEDGKLTPVEESLSELARPKTETEAQLFQTMASIRFGLTDIDISMDMLKKPTLERSSIILYQCG
ncbi:hypothetical protein P4O66_012314 [Electrophorus voltai]|uniref:Uncharacterized protein n=1 Tax=Electrophorus voltai TaxID=2609070 RepID=A0AAD8Z6N8_9TELE|nr:hypothetical protein P4O66_012314 [Electrophorus voltai]